MPQTGNTFSATIKGLDKTVNWLDQSRAVAIKAHQTAVKVEGFRLKKKLQQEIRQGRPGGRQHTPLSYIARRLNKKVLIMGGITRRQSPNRAPIERLAHGIRYNIGQNPFEMKVGFVQPTTGPHTVSESWRRLALLHQRGFTRNITRDQRKFIIKRGGSLGKIDGGDTPFFLRQTTRKFDSPARPIIEPFWQANERTAEKNIRNNFKAKLKGKRI